MGNSLSAAQACSDITDPIQAQSFPYIALFQPILVLLKPGGFDRPAQLLVWLIAVLIFVTFQLVNYQVLPQWQNNSWNFPEKTWWVSFIFAFIVYMFFMIIIVQFPLRVPACDFAVKRALRSLDNTFGPEVEDWNIRLWESLRQAKISRFGPNSVPPLPPLANQAS